MGPGAKNTMVSKWVTHVFIVPQLSHREAACKKCSHKPSRALCRNKVLSKQHIFVQLPQRFVIIVFFFNRETSVLQCTDW